MKKKLISIVTAVGVVLSFSIPAFAGDIGNTSEELLLDEIKVLEEQGDGTEIGEMAEQMMEDNSDEDADYAIDSTKELKKEIDVLDEASDDYVEELMEVMKNTDPEVYQKVVNEQAAEIVEKLPDLDSIEPSESCVSDDGDGTIEKVDVYELNSGAEIICSVCDEEDAIATGKLPDIFGAGTIKNWVINEKIFKDLGARRVTAYVYFKVGGTQYGKMGVINHYTVNQTNIKLRSSERAALDYMSPITIEEYKAAYHSTKTKLIEEGDKFWAGIDFNVILEKSGKTITFYYGPFASNSKTKHNVAERIYKVYAYVELIELRNRGCHLKQYGKVDYQEW